MPSNNLIKNDHISNYFNFRGLKKIVTPLFAGLMEVDPQRMWNFDRFFQEVTAIVNRKPVHIFYVNTLQNLRVYIMPSDW
jgi:TANK-binding kinase 1